MAVTDELTALGHLGGPATMAMLTDRWRSAAGQFYVLEPPGGWTNEAREDLLHDFLHDKLEDLTAAVVTVREDEVAVVKVTSRIMKNWLIDQARKTDAGAIRVRLEELLREHEVFVRPAGQVHRWALLGVEDASGVDIDSLVAAAIAVPGVRLVRWSDDSRRAPMASGPDLVRVLQAVLQRAGGSVEIGALVTVFRRRFAVTMTALVPLEADDTLPDRLAASVGLSAADAAEAASRAVQVYAQLSDRERRILLRLDDHQAVQALLGVGRSVAYTLIGRVKNVLRELAGEDVNTAEVATELVRLAETDPANDIPGAATADDDTVATSERSVTANEKGARQ